MRFFLKTLSTTFASSLGMSTHNEYIAGAKALLPLVPGVLPFSAICGMAAVDAGFSTWEALGMCFIVYAGAAQLAAVQLYAQGAGAFVIAATVLVINLRFTMYSASLAPHLQKAPAWARFVGGAVLSDQAYGVSIVGLEDRKVSWRFYVGAALCMWAAWNGGNALGVLLGAFVPQTWGLDFAVPLSFLALLFPALRDRPCAIAALVGGTVAVIGAALPYNLGLMAGAAAGILAGVFMEWRRGWK